MRKIILLTMTLILAACSGGGGAIAGGGNVGGGDCSVAGQKEAVLQAMRDWYLWNANLPASVNTASYATPEDLLVFLTSFSPDDGMGNQVDRFSFINDQEAESQLFGEGQFEGFGFTRIFVGPDDVRLARVFEDSPAFLGGLRRGQRILELNNRTIAEIEAAEGINAVFATTPVTFRMQRPDNTEFTVLIAHDLVTIDPVPQFRVIDDGVNPPIGYLELVTFITPAEMRFEQAFAAFNAAGVNDVIIDVRWNGGGLLTTTELLGDYLGGVAAQNLPFYSLEFNADRAAANNFTAFFGLLGNSINVSRLVMIANRSSASASEMIPNGLDPHINVSIVGDRTFGKPVGQVGLNYCDKVLRPASFSITNADGVGDYFNGLPADCAVAEDLTVPIGDDADPHIVAATTLLNTGACPIVAVPSQFSKPYFDESVRAPDYAERPEREYANAY